MRAADALSQHQPSGSCRRCCADRRVNGSTERPQGNARISRVPRGHRRASFRRLRWRDLERARVARLASRASGVIIQQHGGMSAREDFLIWVHTVLKDAEVAVHNGDASPRRAIWSPNDPVTVLGAWKNASGQTELDELFAHLAEASRTAPPTSSSCSRPRSWVMSPTPLGSSTRRRRSMGCRAPTRCEQRRSTGEKTASGRWRTATAARHQADRKILEGPLPAAIAPQRSPRAHPGPASISERPCRTRPRFLSRVGGALRLTAACRRWLRSWRAWWSPPWRRRATPRRGLRVSVADGTACRRWGGPEVGSAWDAGACGQYASHRRRW
jgi:hypothetical protein